MASSSKRRPASSGKKGSASKARVISVRSADALPRKGNASVGRRKPVVEPSVDARPTTATRAKTTRATGRASSKRKKPALLEVALTKSVAAPETIEGATPVAAPETLAAATPVAPPETIEGATPVAAPEAIEVAAPVAALETIEGATPVAAPETLAAATPVAPPDTLAAATPVAARSELASTAAPAAPGLITFETEVVVDTSAIVEEIAIVEEPPALRAEAVTAPAGELQPRPSSEETRGPQPARTAAVRGAPATAAPDHAKRAVVTAVSRVLSTLLRWTGVRR